MNKCKEVVDELHFLADRFQISLTLPDDSLYISKLSEFFDEIDDRTAFGRRLRDYMVLTPQQVVMEVAVPITYSLINEITDAFHCAPVLQGFSVFNMKNVPESMVEMRTYGDPQIDALAKHYGNTKVDVFKGHRSVAELKYAEAEYRTQFQQFKAQLCLMKQRCSGDPITLLKQPEYANSFPAVNHLVTLSQLIPPSTASVERLFSLMNRLCTPSRTGWTSTLLMQS